MAACHHDQAQKIYIILVIGQTFRQSSDMPQILGFNASYRANYNFGTLDNHRYEKTQPHNHDKLLIKFIGCICFTFEKMDKLDMIGLNYAVVEMVVEIVPQSSSTH